MANLLELPTNIVCEQPRWNSRFWELRTPDGTVFATLEQPSIWKKHARVVFDNRKLTLQSVNFWQTKFAIRDEASGVDVAEYATSKRTLSCKTGRVFNWRRKGFWRPVQLFAASDNEEIVFFRTRSRGFRTITDVTISPFGLKYPELPVLVGFGCYLMLIAAAQNAGGAG